MRTSLKAMVLNTLSDSKASNICTLDVANITSITDDMIIATGNSTTHVKAISDKIVKESKNLAITPLGVEGRESSEWVLVDLGELVVHIMLPGTRAFYNLEKLWAPFDAVTASA